MPWLCWKLDRGAGPVCGSCQREGCTGLVVLKLGAFTIAWSIESRGGWVMATALDGHMDTMAPSVSLL